MRFRKTLIISISVSAIVSVSACMFFINNKKDEAFYWGMVLERMTFLALSQKKGCDHYRQLATTILSENLLVLDSLTTVREYHICSVWGQDLKNMMMAEGMKMQNKQFETLKKKLNIIDSACKNFTTVH